MSKLHRYYTDYELTTLCEDCAAARGANGEHVQWAETPPDWELAGLTCYDCDGPNDATDDVRPPNEDQIRLECTFWVPELGTCGWTGLASEADWCPHFETWVCPQCAASDGLRIIEELTREQAQATIERELTPDSNPAQTLTVGLLDAIGRIQKASIID
jgi:hypothetical protein